MSLIAVVERILRRMKWSTCSSMSTATEMFRRMCVNGEILGFGDLEVNDDPSLQSNVVVN